MQANYLDDRKTIRDALNEDDRCRHPGVTEGLYPLESLGPFRRLHRSLPVIQRESKREDLKNSDRAHSSEEFLRRLREVSPLADFDFEGNRMCLAGGAVCGLVMRPPQGPGADPSLNNFHDFDLFLVGHESDESATAAIAALERYLHDRWCTPRSHKLQSFRTQGCVTFRYDDWPEKSSEVLVQVILRRYATKAEVIHGFDLGSSAMLWDGKRVLLTALGALAAERGANVLNLKARRASYEHRLTRYFERGFEIVLPDLDSKALRALRGRLPYLNLFGLKRPLEALGGQGLVASHLGATRPGCDANGCRLVADAPKPEPTPESFYSYSVDYSNEVGIQRRNLRAMADNDNPRFARMCAFAGCGGGDLPIVKTNPQTDFDLVVAMVKGCFTAEGVKLPALKCYLGVDRAAELILQSLSAGGDCPANKIIKAVVRDRLAEIEPRLVLPFEYMAVLDKTALTGPFPRDLVTEAEWYGQAGKL